MLQAAIQGRLTQQLPEDGDAETLYAEIQKEKQKLIKEGKIKKEKPLPEITEDDIPFDIPENWKWVRLRNICTKIVDGDHNPPKGELSKSDYLMLSSQNINNDRLIDLDRCRYLSKEKFEVENQRTNVSVGDILLTTVATLGRSCIFNGGVNVCFQRSVSVVTTVIYNRYLKAVFDSPYFQNLMVAESAGTAQKGFYLNQLSESIIPVPPLAEQKRIVARVDELLKKIEEMEKTERDIIALYDAFPGDMKASLLQAAIQGKLTEQLASDGDAETLYADIQKEKQRLIKEGKIKKDKPLPAITEDDIPFDIPENWKWVRQAEVCKIYTGNSIPEHIKLEKYMNPGIEGYNYIGTKDVSFDHVVDYENGVRIPYSERGFKLAPEGSSLICIEGGSAGRKVGFLSQTVCFGNKLCMFNPYLIDQKYIYYWLQSPAFLESFFERMNGIIGGVKINALSNIIMPLPPLAEQKRIVEKLDQLLPLCDSMKEAIDATA